MLTCEIVSEIGKVVFEDFDRTGCSWGYSNLVFYERNLAYLGEFLNGDCEWSSGTLTDRSDPNVASAVSSIITHVARNPEKELLLILNSV